MSDPFLPDQPDVDPDVSRRLTAAFGALAQAEVPTAAPRPAAAPRPLARRGPSTRRRWGIAGGGLLVAAAAVVLALLLGTEVFDARVGPTTGPPATVGSTTPAVTTAPATSGPPSTSTAPSTPTSATASTPPTPRTSAPDPATVAAAFAAVTTATRSAVVTVPGGYEGVDLTGGTDIRLFTSTDGTTWSQAGTSTYPPLAFGGPPASVEAAGLPSGAAHAVFVVSDQYATGDGTGVDVAFTDGPAGFGAVKGAADGDLHASGSGVPALGDVGTSFRADFRNGLLVTVECSDTAPDNASCGDAAYQVAKYWSWNGDVFVLDHRTGPAS